MLPRLVLPTPQTVAAPDAPSAPAPARPLALVSVVAVVALAGSVALLLLAPAWRWVHPPVHAVMEGAGALVALALAALLLRAHAGWGGWVAMAAASMGVLDLVHATAEVGGAFFWGRGLSTISGGLLFSLVWLSAVAPVSRRAVLGAGALSVAIGALIVAFPGSLPMAHAFGAYTPAAKLVNLLGGVGFLLGAAYFLAEHRRDPRGVILVFATHAMLLGVAGLSYPLSELWGAVWWYYHVLRLVAYLLVLRYAYAVYEEMLKTQAAAVERDRRLATERKARQEAERAAANTRRLQVLTERLADATTPEEIGRAIAAHVEAGFGTAAAFLAVPAPDADDTLLVLGAPQGGTAAGVSWRRLPLSSSFPIVEVFGSGRPQFVETPAALPALAPEVRDMLTRRGVQASALLPLRLDERPLGALALDFVAPRAFDDDERAQLLAMGRQCALALERLRLQGSVRQSEARLRRLVDANLVGVIFWRLEGGIVEANDAFLKMVGYTRDEVAGGDVDWRRLTPARLEGGDAEQVELLRTQGFHPPFEKVYLHKDGREVPVLVASAVFPGSADEGVAFVVDLTGQKAVEAELQQAVRTRDEFLSIASHELKTPLTSLKMQIDRRRRQLAKGSAAPLDPEDVAKLLAAESRQVDRLARLIEEMLDVSRINTGRFVVEPQPVELGELAREIARHHAAEAARVGCEITVEAPAPVRGVWDPYRLEQVVSNLLTNAIKYGPGRPIRVSVEARDGRASLRVRDEGRGIAPADQARIFRRFERAVSANEVSGLGIGLFIVQQIVELHGGAVRVDSALGAGSTFTVELPLG